MLSTLNERNSTQEIKMLTLDQIKELLKDTNYSAVAESAGIHPNTVYRLMNGQEPKYGTVKALSDYFEDKGFSHESN